MAIKNADLIGIKFLYIARHVYPAKIQKAVGNKRVLVV